MKKLLSLGVWILLSSLHLFGQEQQTKKFYDEIIPVSPNAAALGTYGAVPVGYYTGTANVSIPIYEIDLDGKKIPISLSYHTSGIKVAQEASSVGLGWALNAGGTITAEIHGFFDFDKADRHHGFYWDTDFTPPIGDVMPRNEYYLDYINQNKDSEPDIFYYNFCGFSGSLFFDKMNAPGNSREKAKGILQNPDSYIDVTYDLIAEQWIIVDNLGYTYYFKRGETTQTISTQDNTFFDPVTLTRQKIGTGNPDQSSKRNPTAWNLDLIISPKGNKIEFLYKAEEIYTPITVTENAYLFADYIEQAPPAGNIKSSYLHYNYSYSRIIQQVLDKIIFHGGEIVFHKSLREDVEGVENTPNPIPQKIDGITIHAPANPVPIKEVKLDYSYVGVSDDFLHRRLMLQSVKDGDKVYSFEYDKGVLPAKNSLDTDFWGYYNSGKLDNFSEANGRYYTIPSCFIRIPNKALFYNGRDKTPDYTRSQFGILKAVNYPTQAQSIFTYGPHIFESSVDFPGFNGFKEITLGQVDYKTFDNYNRIADFVVKDSSIVCKVEYSMLFKNIPEKWGDGDFIGLVLYKKNEKGEYVGVGNGQGGGFDDKMRLSEIACNSSECSGSSIAYSRTLLKGEYRMQINWALTYHHEYNKDQPDHNYFMGQISMKTIAEDIDSALISRKGGAGLRIEKIRNTGNNTDEIKQFEYEDGKLMVPPVYHRYVVLNVLDGLSIYGSWHFEQEAGIYIQGTSTLQYPVSRQTVGYSNVREFQGQGNGYTEYKFHNSFNRMESKYSYMPGYPTIYDFQNGSPLQVSIYDNNNAPKQIKQYLYSLGQEKSVSGFMLYKPELGENGFWAPYSLEAPKYVLESEITTNYFDIGVTKQTVDYFYDPIYFLNNSTKTTDSKQQEQIQQIKYPFDFSDANSMEMKNRGMLAYPIETISYTDGSETSRTKNNYSLFASNNQILPSSTESSTTGLVNLHTDITFDLYDDKGNILQYTERDGIPVSFIWGYDQKYPVAKIIGTTIEQVKIAFGGMIPNLGQGTFTLNQEEKLRTQLPSAQITTYTYRPLFGVSSETDPNGLTTHYEYDSFGRLYRILDNDRNIIKQYKYHYKN